ncbi:MAG: hypothetical protein IPJ27_15295 [Candidatus Accumulibacter sp.]|uniref:Uncharacterized protein n=1 Tax=Candidatus Accumulibacter proximus TaxID=2954385 RepID=A0A935UHZ0_9PROT|nr:hypothetical protein [Candidatus Accumulibacter proximus]
MLESAVRWMSYPLYYAWRRQPTRRRRARDDLPTAVSTARRQTVVLGLQNEREWAVFLHRAVLDRLEPRGRPALRLNACARARDELKAARSSVASPGLSARATDRPPRDAAQIANA